MLVVLESIKFTYFTRYYIHQIQICAGMKIIQECFFDITNFSILNQFLFLADNYRHHHLSATAETDFKISLHMSMSCIALLRSSILMPVSRLTTAG